MAKDHAAPMSLSPDATFKRLPSFKTPRDLKLTQFANPLGEARTKKVFVPNLNVQRRKQNDDGGSGSNSGQSDDRRERGRNERPASERGRGRMRKQFVQGSGVFSEGLAPQLKSRSARLSAGSQDPSTTIPKPRLKLNELVKLDKEEEDLILKELMREDFIDDPSLQPDLESSPIHLPLTKLEDLKLEPAKEEIVEKQPIDAVVANGVRIKKEPGVEETQVAPPLDKEPVSAADLRHPSAAQIIGQSHNSNFIFFQIPNSIPRLKVPDSTHAKTSKTKPPQGSHHKDSEENEEDGERRTLRSLPPGRIGTLQILKSGRACLLLGDVKLQVEPGTQVAFKQELVSVDVNKDDKTGNIIHLGNIMTRMLITPDWEALLSTPT